MYNIFSEKDILLWGGGREYDLKKGYWLMITFLKSKLKKNVN